MILGLSDGSEPGAALVVDDRLVATAPGVRGGGVPWAAATEVVARAGLAADDVEMVAVPGRYTPPFAARQRPELRTRAQDPFAWTRAGGTRVQGWLRSTGLGAWDADRATEWFEGQFRDRGYRPRRVVLVDLHKSLASAAYRCQPSDDVLILVAHPLGDGALTSVHRGQAGQIDRLELDRGSTASQLWLERWWAVLGVADRCAFDTLADAGTVDPASLEVLERSLSTADGRIVSHARHGLVLRTDPPWSALVHLAPAVAAATVRAHVRDVVCRWATDRIVRHGARDVAIAGSWADDPEIPARLAEHPGVERLWAGPWVGGAGSAVGAALTVAGLPPVFLEGRGPAPSPSDADCRAAAGASAVPATVARMVAILAGGGAVARFAGPASNTPDGGGSRSVLVRADDPEAVERARLALGRPSSEVPPVLALPGALPVPHADKLAGPLRYGTVSADLYGRRRRVAEVEDGALAALLRGLEQAADCPAVAVLPLGVGGDRAAATPEEAVRVWRRSELPWITLGSLGLDRG